MVYYNLWKDGKVLKNYWEIEKIILKEMRNNDIVPDDLIQILHDISRIKAVLWKKMVLDVRNDLETS